MWHDAEVVAALGATDLVNAACAQRALHKPGSEIGRHSLLEKTLPGLPAALASYLPNPEALFGCMVNSEIQAISSDCIDRIVSTLREAHAPGNARAASSGQPNRRSSRDLLRLPRPATSIVVDGKSQPAAFELISAQRGGQGGQQVSWVYIEEYHPFRVAANYLYQWCKAPTRWLDHEIQQWFRRTFGWRFDALVIPLQRVCSVINIAFFGKTMPEVATIQQAPARFIPVRRLIATIEKALDLDEFLRGAHRLENTPTVAKGLLFVLLWCGILRLSRAVQHSGSRTDEIQCASAVRPAEHAYLLAKIAGALSGVSGLTYVYRGGMLPEPDRGRVTLVTGEPGVGKTAFALHMMADVASRGRVAIYMSLGEPYDWILRRLVSFGLKNDERFLVEYGDAEHLANLPHDGRGLLYFYGQELRRDSSSIGAEGQPLVMLIEELREVLVARRARGNVKGAGGGMWHALAIDPLNALTFGASSADLVSESRLLMNQLVRTIEAARFWGVGVVEADDKRFARLPFEANTVIELKRQNGGNRTLEILKCRTQPYHDGTHAMHLLEGRGIRVRPSLTAFQLNMRTRRRVEVSDQWEIPLPRDAQRNRSVTDAIPVRSSALIEADQRKSALHLALELAFAPRRRIVGSLPERCMRRTERPGAVFLLTFGTPYDRLMRLVRSDQELSEGMQSVGAVHARWFSAGPSLRGSEVLAELFAEFRRGRLAGVPVERLVVEGIESVGDLLPAVEGETLFWPTLHEFALSEEATTFYVVGAPSNELTERAKDRVQSLREIVDYGLVVRGGTASSRRSLFVNKQIGWHS